MPKRKPTDIVNIKVRCSEAFRAHIEREAKKSNRSINREIIHRLGMTFGEEGLALADQFDELEKEMMVQLREVVRRFMADEKAKKGADQ
jgi:hypothetical protein